MIQRMGLKRTRLGRAPSSPRRFARSLLVDDAGAPLRARKLVTGEPQLFNYPFAASPVFLLQLDRAVAAADLQTEAHEAYSAPAGVGAGFESRPPSGGRLPMGPCP